MRVYLEEFAADANADETEAFSEVFDYVSDNVRQATSGQ